jgi:Sec-independent protein translocase protein TatA
MKELYPWISVGVVILGFIGQGFFGSFRLGRAVGELKSALKQQIDDERDKILAEIKRLETKFADEQRTQDHNFGEVGHAMREKIATVENKLREVEIYGRDNYVKIPDFERAIERLSADFKSGLGELRDDIRDLLKGKPS